MMLGMKIKNSTEIKLEIYKKNCVTNKLHEERNNPKVADTRYDADKDTGNQKQQYMAC